MTGIVDRMKGKNTMFNGFMGLLSGRANTRTTAAMGVLLGIFILTPMLNSSGFCASPSTKKDVVEMKNILIDKVNKAIRIKVKLAIREGILEYLLVSEPGKTYESVFKVIENVPSELNFALLLIGSKPLRFDNFMKLHQDKKGLEKLLKNHGESIVELDLYHKGKPISLDKLLKNREGAKLSLTWVHTGGLFIKDNKYAGDLELSHIGVWPDVTAVINLFSAMGNPYQGAGGLEMNSGNKKMMPEQDYEIVIRRKKQ